MFETPILFIIFNRPDSTQQVFNLIRKVQPKYFYVSADGPRENNLNDIEKCRLTREIISGVDWHCELKTFFREENRGCGRGPAEAITWFFEQVEEGIILEDDCVPHPEFFNFCEILLKRYKDNPLILSISGSNFQNGNIRGKASYYFSIHNKIWGWATWRRTWENYDYLLNNITLEEFVSILKNLFSHKAERNYWLKVFNFSKDTHKHNSAWDFQFMFLQWKLGGLTITSNTNLVKNIGFTDDATHTRWGSNNPHFKRKVAPIYPLVHPDSIKRDIQADDFYFMKYVRPKNILRVRLERNIRKLILKMKI